MSQLVLPAPITVLASAISQRCPSLAGPSFQKSLSECRNRRTPTLMRTRKLHLCQAVSALNIVQPSVQLPDIRKVFFSHPSPPPSFLCQTRTLSLPVSIRDPVQLRPLNQNRVCLSNSNTLMCGHQYINEVLVESACLHRYSRHCWTDEI